VTRVHQSEEAWPQTENHIGNRGMPGTTEQRATVVKYLAADLGL